MSSFLAFKEISILDQTLVGWYEALPPFMKSPYPCPSELHDVRNILKWRYLNMRMILHRAVVLDTTERQVPFRNLGSEEQDVVRQCRNIAAESIFAIQVDWRPNKMCGWNAVWFLFQACLVPLMALAVESEEHEDYLKWQEQVVVVIELCEMMDSWSLVGRKTKEVIQKLFEASKRPHNMMVTSDQLAGFIQDPQECFFGDSWQEVLSDESFYDLNLTSYL